MTKPIGQFLLGLFFALISLPVCATDLLDIYCQATQCDPVFQAAKSTRLANREALPQSLATLLPNLSAIANTTGNTLTILDAPNFNFPAQGTTTNFNSGGYTLTLSQPLISPVNWMQVQAAHATARQADATFGAAGQDLMIRVAQDYFNVLQAEDNLQYSQAQKAANKRQLDQAKERFNVGLDSITSVYNAQASYDAASANEISAQNAVRNNLEALRQLTGETYDSIEAFKIPVPLLTPQPIDVELWVNAAECQNLTLLAQRYAVLSARAQVKENFAGHSPTLNAVGTVSRQNGAVFGTINFDQKTAGLQLSVPIFAGGLVLSQTRQAEDNYATASANMENAYRQAVVTTRQKFNDVMSGINEVSADITAIKSAQSSVDSTEESFKVGTRTIVDVLLAQNTLYQARFNYARDVYAYLISTLQLKQAAGTLKMEDLQEINFWLHEAPSQTAMYSSRMYSFGKSCSCKAKVTKTKSRAKMKAKVKSKKNGVT